MADPNPLAVFATRLTLLARACRGEFAAAPIGAFEAEWNAADPATPLPSRDDYTTRKRPDWSTTAEVAPAPVVKAEQEA